MDSNMERLEKKIEQQAKPEVLKTPEILLQEENGAQLLSLLLKANNTEWGSCDGSISGEVKNYFEEHPLNPSISSFLDEIGALQENGVDEEVLYILALTYGRPERKEGAFKVIREHKAYIKNPEELQQKLFGALEIFEHSFILSPLAKKMTAEIEKDKEARKRISAETQARIERLIKFFRPDPATTEIRRVSLMPTDPLYKKDSGAAFVFGQELVLKSHIENPDNLDHEFCHSIINPIVEKLSRLLDEEQKEKIAQFASEKLKQDYGEGHFSLLCEEFIRTYNDVFKKGEKPQSYEDFVQKISTLTEDQFQKFLGQSESLKSRCEKLGIASVEDFKNKSQKYYERFEKNKLRDLIFGFYQKYSTQSEREGENFEQFVLKNFPELLK